jgi:hypothetical protein
MKFKEVEFSEVPAFDLFRSRLEALRPAYKLVKAGKEFDVNLYRLYVQKPNAIRRPIDIGENLLRDIEQNPHGSESSYTKGLLLKLNGLIEVAIPAQDQL